MNTLSIERHQSIFDPATLRERIHIIGCGATGSRVFASLVELGVTNISCYDYDVIEAHNLANQLYTHAQIGKKKVEGLKEWFELKTGKPAPAEMEFCDIKVERGAVAPLHFDGIVFFLVDSIAARKEIMEYFLIPNTDTALVLETRMASSYGNVFTLPRSKKSDVIWKKWVDTLPTDETAELSPCGTPISVGVTASLIANLAVWQLINWHSKNVVVEKLTAYFTMNMYILETV